MSLRHRSSLAFAVAVSSAPSLALATPNFPATIRSHLALDYQPPCTLCHASVSGGGPVVTPVGSSLAQRGLAGNDEASLQTALDQLVTDGADSDGDGMTDVDELLTASDPNATSASSLADLPPLEHGCVGQIAPRGTLGAPWLAGVLAASVLLGRSRARRRKAARSRSRPSLCPDGRLPRPERTHPIRRKVLSR